MILSKLGNKLNFVTPMNKKIHSPQSPEKNPAARPPLADKLLSGKPTTGKLLKWKGSVSLPYKQQTKRLPVTRSQEDQSHFYKYKEEPKELLSKRSDLKEVSQFILRLIKKSETQELSNTDKYMLSGYINVYIKEKCLLRDNSKDGGLTVEKLKAEWAEVCDIFELYKVKIIKCQIGDQWDVKEEENVKNFQALYQEVSNLKNKKEKLDQIRKLMKKFYSELST